MKKKSIDYRAALVVAASLAGASMLSSAPRNSANESLQYRWHTRDDATYRRYLADLWREYRGLASLGLLQQREPCG
jgi:hypothetical protein